MKRFFFFTIIISFAITVNAAIVDTIVIYSNSMKKEIKCVVIRPDSYKTKSISYPVVYLLHGWSGKFSDWIIKMPAIKQEADKLQLIIVCPDGHYSSWYFDSPIDPAMKYETYVGTEVPAYIDSHYRTIKDRKGRAVTGLSMGGHGALFLSFRHANTFGACGSMSGGVDLKDSRNKFDVMKRIGDTIANADNWKKYSVINVVDNYPQDSLAIIMDCGIDDFFFNGNVALHEKLLKMKIPHDYIERPGQHDWNYWVNAVKYQLLFFRNYFDK